MSIAPIAGVSAGVLDFFAFLPYIRSILRHETKPNRATFTIWTVVSTVILLSYFSAGARDTIWFVLVYSIMQYIVFGLSFKYGMGGFNKLDILCLLAALVGVILWMRTKNPLSALYINIVLEAIGYAPTIKKAYTHPETENTFAWIVSMTAAFVNIFAITSFVLHIALYPFVILTCNSIVTLLLLFSPYNRKQKKSAI